MLCYRSWSRRTESPVATSVGTHSEESKKTCSCSLFVRCHAFVACSDDPLVCILWSYLQSWPFLDADDAGVAAALEGRESSNSSSSSTGISGFAGEPVEDDGRSR